MATKRPGIEIWYGAMSEPLSKQLEALGVSLPPADVERFQGNADAITRLKLHGLIVERTADTARRKLTQRISTAVAFQRIATGKGRQDGD